MERDLLEAEKRRTALEKTVELLAIELDEITRIVDLLKRETRKNLETLNDENMCLSEGARKVFGIERGKREGEIQ